MNRPRIIARMDVKNNNLIKGIQLEGLRIIGNIDSYAEEYYRNGADELIYLDSVASLYYRSYIIDIIKKAAKKIFIPLTVGGGVKTIKDVEKVLRAGADKVAINTAAVKNPQIITDVAKVFGSQCMVLQIDAKKMNLGYEVYIDGGREKTGIDVLEWAKRGMNLGCGEIMLTSIDHDGTKKGFDLDLLEKVSSVIDVPLIVSGGMGKLSHLNPLTHKSFVDGIAIGTAFHYKICTPIDVKNYMGC